MTFITTLFAFNTTKVNGRRISDDSPVIYTKNGTNAETYGDLRSLRGLFFLQKNRFILFITGFLKSHHPSLSEKNVL